MKKKKKTRRFTNLKLRSCNVQGDETALPETV